MNTSDANTYRGRQQDRREHPRVKVRATVELRREGNEVPIGGATSDISLGGCYIEMMFTLAKDTKLDITIKIAGRTPTGGTDPGTGESAPASAGGANHDWHDRGRDHPARTHFDQESGAAARSGDAPDEEGQTMVLRDEGARGGG